MLYFINTILFQNTHENLKSRNPELSLHQINNFCLFIILIYLVPEKILK